MIWNFKRHTSATIYCTRMQLFPPWKLSVCLRVRNFRAIHPVLLLLLQCFIEFSQRCTIFFTAKLGVSIYPTERVADIGEMVTFNCSIRGYPVSTVRWTKDARNIKDGTRVRIVSKNQLLLTSVRREDHGIYQCFAGNDADSSQASAQMMIGGK